MININFNLLLKFHQTQEAVLRFVAIALLSSTNFIFSISINKLSENSAVKTYIKNLYMKRYLVISSIPMMS